MKSWSAELNRQLADLYESKWDDICRIVPAGTIYSNPFLINVTESYVKAPVKLMVVGQETCSWFGSFESEPKADRIARLQYVYSDFNFAVAYRSTPFWRAVHQLRENFNPASSRDCVAWGNINLVDKDRSRALDIEGQLAELGILRREVEILKPDVLVFLTGPNYDWLISKQFPNAVFSETDGSPFRLLCRINHQALPTATLRTYHPAYLQRSKNWEVLERIYK